MLCLPEERKHKEGHETMKTYYAEVEEFQQSPHKAEGE